MNSFALKVLSYRLCRRMCGEALPRRALSEGNGARPLVRPWAREYWGKSPNRGHSPSLIRKDGEAKPRRTSGGKAGPEGLLRHQSRHE